MSKKVHGLTIDDMRDGYVDLVNYVMGAGEEVSPRGYKTLEVEDFTFKLTNPLDAIPIGVGRAPKLTIPAAEALLMCGGIHSPSLLSNITKTFRRFMDGGDLHGGYGRRLAAQLPRAVERLAHDNDTRQCVLTIWDPAYDQVDTRDLPCTIALNFRVRKGVLNAGVVMRSNDVWLGVPYDVFVFTQLQATIANVLGLEVGTYSHHAWSMHAYERNFDAIANLHPYHNQAAREEVDGVPVWDEYPCGFGGKRSPSGFGVKSNMRTMVSIPARVWMEKAMQRAQAIYDGEPLLNPTDSELWYAETLRPFDRLTRTDNFSS